MSGNADTIKDFLVSLGFDIDQAGANKFEAVLKGVTANVLMPHRKPVPAPSRLCPPLKDWLVSCVAIRVRKAS